MDAIIAQVHALAKEADQATRKSIQNALEGLLLEVQGPLDLTVHLLNSSVRLAVARLGIDLKLFETLSSSDSPRSVSSLADQLKADPSLLARVLRYLASNNLVRRTGIEEFTGNQATRILAEKSTDALTSHGFHIMGPTIQAAPAFLAETGYQDITNPRETPFQKAFHTDKAIFEWLADHPTHMQAAQLSMASTQSSDGFRDFTLLDDAARSFIDSTPPSSDRPFFVDVGGSYGHQSVHLRDKHPGLGGHLVLQDMPQVVEQVPRLDGIKVMAQDFFMPQAIQGAHFYYFRRILHDWPDEECVKILKNIVPVMANDSQILIDEIVLPDTNVSFQAAMGDLYMMFMGGGKERTEKQWTALADEAGLKVVHLHVYDSTHHVSVLVLEKK